MSVREMMFDDTPNYTCEEEYSRPQEFLPEALKHLCNKAIHLWLTIKEMREDWQDITNNPEPVEVIAYLGGRLTAMLYDISDLYYHVAESDVVGSRVLIRENEQGRVEVYDTKTNLPIYPENSGERLERGYYQR